MSEFDGLRVMDPQETVRQIGIGNMMAISGGRWSTSGTGRDVYRMHLPVGSGYRVDIEVAGNDTYTVRRVFRRGSKEWVKGERSGVYYDDLGQAAYYASCYVSYDEAEWPQKA